MDLSETNLGTRSKKRIWLITNAFTKGKRTRQQVDYPHGQHLGHRSCLHMCNDRWDCCLHSVVSVRAVQHFVRTWRRKARLKLHKRTLLCSFLIYWKNQKRIPPSIIKYIYEFTLGACSDTTLCPFTLWARRQLAAERRPRGSGAWCQICQLAAPSRARGFFVALESSVPQVLNTRQEQATMREQQLQEIVSCFRTEAFPARFEALMKALCFEVTYAEAVDSGLTASMRRVLCDEEERRNLPRILLILLHKLSRSWSRCGCVICSKTLVVR